MKSKIKDPESFTSEKSLLLENEKNQARFELGICMALREWEDLSIAIANNWGGSNGDDKRDWFAGVILDLFDQKTVYTQDIEYRLLQVMEDEYDTIIEDDSAYEISVLIMDMYKNAKQGDFTRIDQLFEKFKIKGDKIDNNLIVTLQNQDGSNHLSDNDDDYEDVDDDDIDVDDINNNNQQIPNLINTQSSSSEQSQNNDPIVDEDGFELVQRRRRR